MVGRRSFPFGKVSIFRCVLVSFREGKLPGICPFFQLTPKRLKDGRVTEATCFVGPKKHPPSFLSGLHPLELQHTKHLGLQHVLNKDSKQILGSFGYHS